jgi:hypothetical protein
MVTWDIRRAGHAYAWGGEAMSRYEMTPEKTEMVAGKLYGTEEERLTMLALLLENVGADKAVRIGDPDIWRAAVDELSDGREGQQHEPSAPLLPEAERRALEAALLSTAHAQHEALKQLLDASSDHWGFEDPVYRFYRDAAHRRGVLSRAVLSRDGRLLCEVGGPSATPAERLRRTAALVSTQMIPEDRGSLRSEPSAG